MNLKNKREKGIVGKKIIVLFYIILGALFALTLYFCISWAPSIGAVAGIANGSRKGIEKGIAKGITDGKMEGLSAKDTKVKFEDKISQTGKLEVMLADIRLTDLYQQENKYAALYIMPGEGVFSIDLMHAEIEYDEGNGIISILMEEPEFVPYFDDSKVERIAEYKAPHFDGKTEDGYQGYLNTREQLSIKVQEELSNGLMEQAKLSGIKQVEQLARSVCGSNVAVNVGYRENEE